MLVNKQLANKKVATIYGDITFNEKGESKDLTIGQRKDLGKLPGFKYVEDEKKTDKKESENNDKPKTKPKVKQKGKTKKEEK